MINQQTLQGNWNEIAGKLRSKWGQLSGDEFQQFNGTATQLIGLIQRKTGEAREHIEAFLNDLTANGAEAVSQGAGAVQSFASQATQTVKDGAEAVSRRARDGYEAAEQFIEERPKESVAASFGIGLLFGVILSLLFRSHR